MGECEVTKLVDLKQIFLEVQSEINYLFLFFHLLPSRKSIKKQGFGTLLLLTFNWNPQGIISTRYKLKDLGGISTSQGSLFVKLIIRIVPYLSWTPAYTSPSKIYLRKHKSTVLWFLNPYVRSTCSLWRGQNG